VIDGERKDGGVVGVKFGDVAVRVAVVTDELPADQTSVCLGESFGFGGVRQATRRWGDVQIGGIVRSMAMVRVWLGVDVRRVMAMSAGRLRGAEGIRLSGSSVMLSGEATTAEKGLTVRNAVVEGVAHVVVKALFGKCVGEEVVSEGVEGFGAERAGGGWGQGEEGETEFAAEEYAVLVGVQACVGVLPG
jgi:hypothetical protein